MQGRESMFIEDMLQKDGHCADIKKEFGLK